MKKHLTLLLQAFLLVAPTLLLAQPFKVVGYLPTYRFSWLNDIEFQRVTHVNISFANPDSLGNLSCEGVNIDPAIAKAHAGGCQVFISLAGGYLTPEWDANWNHLTLPANRAAFIQKIVQYVQAHNLDGVDMDLEWQYVHDWYSPFVLELKAALEPLDKPLTAALPGSYRYPEITDEAMAAFDWINLMVYDLTGPWAPNNPGQHSPYPWAEQCIQYWITQGQPAAQLTLGVPFYGYDFGANPVGSFTYRGIVNQDVANAQLDQSGQKYWNGIPTIQAKTALALEQVSGIMIWELGEDAFGDNSQYSLLRAIDEVVTAATDTREPVLSTVQIYPNPASDWAVVQWAAGHSAQIRVLDAQGQTVLTQTSSNERIVLNVSQLPAGWYTLLVQTAGHFGRGRLAILR